jgi:hypothetical protein
MEVVDNENDALAALLVGLASGALVAEGMKADGALRGPIRVEYSDGADGIVRLRLASGMLATIRVTVSRPVATTGDWYHHGHYHPAGDEPHEHPGPPPKWGH